MYRYINFSLFHRFIPGTSASDVHYQAYLIDGITRWNRDRASTSLGVNTQSMRTFDVALQQKVSTVKNIIHVQVHVHYLYMYMLVTMNVTTS